jgi:cysteine synthase
MIYQNVLEMIGNTPILKMNKIVHESKFIQKNDNKNIQVFAKIEGLNPGDKVVTSSYDSFGDTEELILK